MRHIFIINPKAGKGNKVSEIKAKILSFFAEKAEKFDIYVTEYAGHESEIAEKVAQSGEDVRIYAVGGDGTLNKVVRGMYKYKNAAVTVIPCGSGNDFVKMGGREKSAFYELEKVIDGEERVIDIYKVGEENVGVNIGSVGFDATICAEVNKYSRFLPGKVAYMFSLLICLFTKLKNSFSIKVDGENGRIEMQGNYLLCSAANGRFYGGSFNPAPYAELNDGLLDFIFIKSVSPFKILSLLNKYKAGVHIEKLKKYVTYIRGKRIEIRGKEKVAVQYDGNVEYSDSAIFEIMPKALRFVFPKA